MKTNQTILSLILLTVCYSCESFIDVPLPKQRLISQSTFENEDTANAAMTNIYSSLNNNPGLPYQIALYTGLSADELTTYSNTLGTVQIYENDQNPNDASTSIIWTTFYNIIYQCNAVLEGCRQSQKLSDALKKQLIAEALFIRAFSHFYLVNLFGPIPVITNTDYAFNVAIRQSSIDQVYQQITTDLLQAKQDLNPAYVGANGLSGIADRVRPNSFTASALLARVYLYQQKWSEAETEANHVIGQTGLYEMTELARIFLVSSKEAIWQLQMPTPTGNRNTYEGWQFILTARPGVGTGNSSSVNVPLQNGFEAGDNRKNRWIGKYTDGSATPTVDYYYPNKYQVQSSATITERCAVLRLSEQYLIRAEARAQQDKSATAIQDLDVIRERAGLPPVEEVKPSMNKETLLSYILQERQVEFLVEWGHRWMDLKRTGAVDQVMQIVSPQKGGTWANYKQLWPIPMTDLNRAPQLQQNPGYEQ